MSYLIHGGPVGLGGQGLDQLLKAGELPSANEVLRQASIAKARNAQNQPKPGSADSGASGGVESQAQTHEGNAEQDARDRFPPDTFAEGADIAAPPAQAYDAKGSAPAPAPKGEHVDVKT